MKQFHGQVQWLPEVSASCLASFYDKTPEVAASGQEIVQEMIKPQLSFYPSFFVQM